MSGFAMFGSITYLSSPDRPQVADRVLRRLERVGVGRHVSIRTIVTTPGDPRIGLLLTQRAALQAIRDAAEPGLILWGDVLFLDRAGDVLCQVEPELAQSGWNLCYLGGWCPVVPERERGCQYLERVTDLLNPHAVSYSPASISRLLEQWPDSVTATADWISRNNRIEKLIGSAEPAFLVRPAVTTTSELLPSEPIAIQRRYVS